MIVPYTRALYRIDHPWRACPGLKCLQQGGGVVLNFYLQLTTITELRSIYKRLREFEVNINY